MLFTLYKFEFAVTAFSFKIIVNILMKPEHPFLPLVWDATCTDTHAVSHKSNQATHRVGWVAALAEEKKALKYIHI